LEKANSIYSERRDVLVDGLNSIGWKVQKPKATFYVWAKTLKGYDSSAMAAALLEKTDIIATRVSVSDRTERAISVWLLRSTKIG
jgi:LL-diaminopimelate aminotransferase